MPFNIAANQRLASPVSSFIEGRALSLAEKQAKQEMALAEQQQEMNALKLEQMRNPQAAPPSPSDIKTMQEVMDNRSRQRVMAYEAIRETRGEEAAEQFAQASTEQDYEWIKQTYPQLAPLETPTWDYEAERAYHQEKEAGGTPAEVQTFEYLSQGLSPGERERARRIELGLASRAGQTRVIDIGGVPTLVGVTDTGQSFQVPMSSIQNEAGGRAQIELAETEAGRGRLQTPEGTFEAVPGTEAARQEQAAAEAEAQRQASEEQKASFISEEIDRALAIVENDTGPLPATGAGALLSAIPYTDAKALSTRLDTIKANIGFEALNKMRQESPTGGALGQVSERELGFLQAVSGSLDQSQTAEDLAYNLKRIQRAFDIVVNQGLPEGMTADDLQVEDGLPEGVTEEDIEFTMQKHGLSREEVLKRISNAP